MSANSNAKEFRKRLGTHDADINAIVDEMLATMERLESELCAARKRQAASYKDAVETVTMAAHEIEALRKERDELKERLNYYSYTMGESCERTMNEAAETAKRDALAGRMEALVRPLAGMPDDELRLELHLRAGPRFQCQSPDCRAYEDGPGKWNTCPSCGRKGSLCGSFKLDTSSEQYRNWEARTFAKYRSDERPNVELSGLAPSQEVEK